MEMRKNISENFRPPSILSEKIHRSNVLSSGKKIQPKESSSNINGVLKNPQNQQRSPSPTFNSTNRSQTPSFLQRSQSAERRRPTTPNRISALSESRSSASCESRRPTTPNRISVSSESRRPTTPNRISASSERRRPTTPNRFSPSSEGRRPTTPNRISPSSTKSRSLVISSPSSKPSTPARDVVEDTGSVSRLMAPWPSMRSLSASFQGESISGYLKKSDKQLSISIPIPHQMFNSTSIQKSERRNSGNQSENLKPLVDQSRWPSSRNGKISAKLMSTSVDLTEKSCKFNSSSFRKSKNKDEVAEQSGEVKPKTRTNLKSFEAEQAGEVKRITRINIKNLEAEKDAEVKKISKISIKSLESGSTITCPRRTTSLPSISSKVYPSSALSRSMACSSPGRPSTPSIGRVSGSTRSRGSEGSPRPSTPLTPPTPPFDSSGQTGLNLGKCSMGDMPKGKRGSVYLDNVHQLGIMYCRNLQWCFINARAVDLMSNKNLTAERILHGAAITISEMRQSVVCKRISMEQLKLEWKLVSLLREQMIHLEDWGLLDMDHFNSLSGVHEALKASILRLPATNGAKADVPALKEAINSAVGVMQTLCLSIDHLNLSMADKFTAASELVELAAVERSVLRQCGELLSFVAALQVQEFSLRTHLLQLKRDAIRLI